MKYIKDEGIPKTEKYVMSGGPCCGKTTLVEELERRNCYIIEEAARQIIDKEEAIGGDLLPWKNRLWFQKAVIELQKEQEYNIHSAGTVFLDRSMLDNLAYLRLDGVEPSEELYEMFNKFNNYSTVFLPEPLLNYVKNNARKEDEKTVRDIYNMLNWVCGEFGNSIIEIPYYPDSKERRVEFVLDYIANDKNILVWKLEEPICYYKIFNLYLFLQFLWWWRPPLNYKYYLC